MRAELLTTAVPPDREFSMAVPFGFNGYLQAKKAIQKASAVEQCEELDFLYNYEHWLGVKRLILLAKR